MVRRRRERKRLESRLRLVRPLQDNPEGGRLGRALRDHLRDARCLRPHRHDAAPRGHRGRRGRGEDDHRRRRDDPLREPAVLAAHRLHAAQRQVGQHERSGRRRRREMGHARRVHSREQRRQLRRRRLRLAPHPLHRPRQQRGRRRRVLRRHGDGLPRDLQQREPGRRRARRSEQQLLQLHLRLQPRPDLRRADGGLRLQLRLLQKPNGQPPLQLPLLQLDELLHRRQGRDRPPLRRPRKRRLPPPRGFALRRRRRKRPRARDRRVGRPRRGPRPHRRRRGRHRLLRGRHRGLRRVRPRAGARPSRRRRTAARS